MGNETGGLQIPLIADLLYNDLEDTVTMKPYSVDPVYMFYSLNELIVRDDIRGDRCIIGPNAAVEMCNLIESTVIGPFSHVVSSHIVNSSVLSSHINPTT